MPNICSETDCTDGPVSWALKAYTSTSNYGGDVGLARDGHVIKGPYNAAGELWGCDDHDICNGAFLSDGSYAYVTTTTFPYTVGCWGPANSQQAILSSWCTTHSCDGGLSGVVILAGTLAAFLASNVF